MATARKFLAQNPNLLLKDGIALFLAISSQNEIATRQLLREYETSYPPGYAKHITIKTIGLLSLKQRNWLKSLY